MINEDFAVKRIEELIKLLHHYDALYEAGTPEISDSEYDDLYFELQTLENTYDIYPEDSPTQSIHFELKTGLTKVTHNHPMLSLDKTKDMQEVYRFLGDKDFLSMCSFLLLLHLSYSESHNFLLN